MLQFTVFFVFLFSYRIFGTGVAVPNLTLPLVPVSVSFIELFLPYIFNDAVFYFLFPFWI